MIVGGCVIAFSVFIFVASLSIRRIAALAGTLDARFFPQLVAALIAICGISIVISGFAKAKRYSGDEENAVLWPLKDGTICALLTIFTIGIYIFSMEYIGFLLSSFLFLVALMAILAPKGKRNFIQFIIISAVCSTVIYYSFTSRLLNLVLPSGILW